MSEKPSVDIELAVGGTPAGPTSSVGLDLSVTAVLPLPALRVEVDEMRVGLVLELVRGADGFEVVPRVTGPDGPAGAAVAVELPGISGGGQLILSGGEWRGAVALSIGPLKVSGYALLSPNSFLIVMSGRFPQPGIQVGFGFALSGLGGIFGVNRRTDTAALTAAVLDGSLGNLLFPNDPERDMPRILANLPRMFPQQRGQALLGPILELNWAGGLLTAQAALILEGPDPIKVSLIGRLVVDLPAPDVALVHIQATFAAIADFGIPELRIVASLTGSYIVGLTLTGDLFVLIRGGSDSAFVLSAGGFHPDVRPPAGVPPLQRIGAAMGFGFGEIRYESYFAVTTTSVQFGAKAELHAEVADCGIHGWFGFDALIEWLPRFHFSVGITAGVEVEVFGETLLGIRLQGLLEGPSPWHVKAHGEVEVLLVSVSISIDESFGDSPAPLTFVPDIADELVKAVSDPGSWTLHPPSADTDGVVLSAAAAAAVAKGTLLHPAGSLQVRQRLLPFAVTVDRFGGYAVPAQRWVLTGVRLRAGADPVPPQVITDQFALGMFRTMSREEQLATTAFSQQPCGGTITAGGVTTAAARSTELDWETVVVAPVLNRARPLLDRGVLDPAHLSALSDLDVTPFVPSFGRALDIAWPVQPTVSVLAETPVAVVPDAAVVGLVPDALAERFATQVSAVDVARRLSTEGARSSVVEQWELA
jgi:hypothetical protein